MVDLVFKCHNLSPHSNTHCFFETVKCEVYIDLKQNFIECIKGGHVMFYELFSFSNWNMVTHVSDSGPSCSTFT